MNLGVGRSILAPSINAIAMLEFCKTVLRKVSSDRHLFAKELKKSFAFLSFDEAHALKLWALKTYSNRYSQLIVTTFAAVHSLKA